MSQRPHVTDDFKMIRLNMARISSDERDEKCPRNQSLSLYACLRASSKCSEECPHHDLWIGPENASG